MRQAEVPTADGLGTGVSRLLHCNMMSSTNMLDWMYAAHIFPGSTSIYNVYFTGWAQLRRV